MKLTSAQRADGPRWGDYPDKVKPDFIRNLVFKGLWFDGSSPLSLTTVAEEPDFAPKFMMDHKIRFREYLIPPPGLIEEYEKTLT